MTKCTTQAPGFKHGEVQSIRFQQNYAEKQPLPMTREPERGV
jgi:hypothetical protein